MIEFPTILDHRPPRLRGYSRETAVAEKFEAMVNLGLLNIRMKDVFDIWLLARPPAESAVGSGGCHHFHHGYAVPGGDDFRRRRCLPKPLKFVADGSCFGTAPTA
jgi:hypothetical protein